MLPRAESTWICVVAVTFPTAIITITITISTSLTGYDDDSRLFGEYGMCDHSHTIACTLLYMAERRGT